MFEEVIPVLARRYYLPPGTPVPSDFAEPPKDGHRWRVAKVRDEGWNVVTVFWQAAG